MSLDGNTLTNKDIDMKFQVLENGVPCSELAKKIQLDDSWHQDTFDDAQKAEFYASAWACGRMTGPLRVMWEQLAMLPFRMAYDEPQYIRGCCMLIKSIKENAAHD